MLNAESMSVITARVLATHLAHPLAEDVRQSSLYTTQAQLSHKPLEGEALYKAVSLNLPRALHHPPLALAIIAANLWI